LGHRVDAQRVHKSDKHIKAIRDASKPSITEELFLEKTMLWIIYSRFIH